MITTFTYDRANRLQTANAGGSVTTYQNDSAGDRTGAITSTGGVLYTWDAARRMTTAATAAGTVTHTYNADGQRIAKQAVGGATVGFLYDFSRPLLETNGIGGVVSNTFATTTDQSFGDLLEENGRSFHVYDAESNTNVLLDATGAVASRYKYTAFLSQSAYNIGGGAWQQGNIDFSTLPADLRTHFLAGGKKLYYLDPETELILLGSGTIGRYYDPLTARFLSEDPLRQDGGDANLYRYVQNDPVNKLDPSGQ